MKKLFYVKNVKYPAKKKLYMGDVIMEKRKMLYEEHNGLNSLNLSDIWDTLIRAAAKYTDSYASDLMYDYTGVMKYLQEKFDNHENNLEKSFIFGMRKYGIDHDKYVFNPDSVKEQNRYGKIYQLDFKPYIKENGDKWGDYIQVELWEIDYTYNEKYNNAECKYA